MALRMAIKKIEDATKNNHGCELTFLLAYDGKQDMLQAMNAAGKGGGKISEETILKNLWTGALPAVDFVIRTGGEPHWSSGFMMWQTADSEFYFTKTLWPAFGKEEFEKALGEFEKRRRMGGK